MELLAQPEIHMNKTKVIWGRAVSRSLGKRAAVGGGVEGLAGDGGKPVPPLKEGSRIMVRWHPEWFGRIVRLGPEVSEVKFDDGIRRFIPNEQLEGIK